MGRLVGALLEVLQGLLPLAATGGLDPGSLVWPERQTAEVLRWDLVGAEAKGCQLAVQGQKDVAGLVGVGAAAAGVPGAEVLGLAVEGLPGVGVVVEQEDLQAAGRSGGPRSGLLGMKTGCGSPCQGKHPAAAAEAEPESSC